MSTVTKNKKRSGGDNIGNRPNQKNGSNAKMKSGGGEPTEQEMVMFQGLLRAQNTAAMAAHSEFSSSQNKSKFYLDITTICRELSNAASAPASKLSPSVNEDAPIPGKTKPPPTVKNSKNTPGAEKTKKTPRAAASVKTVPPATDTVTVTDTATGSSSAPTPTPTPAVAKKEKEKAVCTFFSTHGSCRKGKRCRFLHPEGQLQGNHWVSPSNSGSSSVANGVDPKVGVSNPSESPPTVSTNGGSMSVSAPVHDSCSETTTTQSNSGSGNGISRSDIPRTNSVDNAMGLLDMDVRYLEENLDMHLEDAGSEGGSTGDKQQQQEKQPEGE